MSLIRKYNSLPIFLGISVLSVAALWLAHSSDSFSHLDIYLNLWLRGLLASKNDQPKLGKLALILKAISLVKRNVSTLSKKLNSKHCHEVKEAEVLQILEDITFLLIELDNIEKSPTISWARKILVLRLQTIEVEVTKLQDNYKHLQSHN